MLRIIICDAERSNRMELRQMLERYLFDKVELNIECYDSSGCFIEQLTQCGEISADLIFMDIQMPEMNGMEIARILRQNQVETDIVFVTGLSEYVFRGYEIHAYDYLLKPLNYHMIENLLERWIAEQEQDGNRYLFVNKKAKKMRIPLKHVRYFISDKRKIRAILDQSYGEVEFYMKMEELEEKLSAHGFVRCHQSYLINIHKVLFWERSRIGLIGEEIIPVSRKYIKTVNQFLSE